MILEGKLELKWIEFDYYNFLLQKKKRSLQIIISHFNMYLLFIQFSECKSAMYQNHLLFSATKYVQVWVWFDSSLTNWVGE